LSHNYAPLQQLFVDLANNSVADYNWITPNQFNDMHTALSGGFMGLTGDAANIRQGDHFLSIVVPAIMASDAYQDRGAIIIWWDETEQDTANANADDFNHTIGEIVISPLAHPNVNGKPFASLVLLSHSSDLRTMQKIFHVTRPLFLGDAVDANDLSDLFAKAARYGTARYGHLGKWPYRWPVPRGTAYLCLCRSNFWATVPSGRIGRYGLHPSQQKFFGRTTRWYGASSRSSTKALIIQGSRIRT